jgi:transcriptional regulator with XRE-family HTH domain
MPSKRKSNIELHVINKVKEFRLKNSLSQSDLAFELDVTNGFIGQVESPSHPAKYNLNHLNHLSRIFNCSPKDFLPEKPLK